MQIVAVYEGVEIAEINTAALLHKDGARAAVFTVPCKLQIFIIVRAFQKRI